MQNACGGGSSKLTLFVVSVAVLVLFCFAAVPSAKATVTTYCRHDHRRKRRRLRYRGNTGLLTINSTADTLEFTSQVVATLERLGMTTGASMCNQTGNCSTLVVSPRANTASMTLGRLQVMPEHVQLSLKLLSCGDEPKTFN